MPFAFHGHFLKPLDSSWESGISGMEWVSTRGQNRDGIVRAEPEPGSCRAAGKQALGQGGDGVSERHLYLPVEPEGGWRQT